MTWFVALGYALAGGLLLAGVAVGADPRIEQRLASLRNETPLDRDLLASVGRRVRASRSRERIERRLASAGKPSVSADRIVGGKLTLAIGGAALGLTTVPGEPLTAVPVTTALVAAGFILPDFLLARRVNARRERASAWVPELLDLLAVSVTAGLTPRLALERAAEALHGPLAEELAVAGRAVALGRSWRQVLREMADRTGLRDVRRLAVTLDRAERLGSPVADHLRELARQVRAERRAAEEERARRAPVAMLFPLVFLILPAFILAAVVPAVLVATRGIV